MQVCCVIPILFRITEDVRNRLFFGFRVAPDVVGVGVELVALAIGQANDVAVAIELVVLHFARGLIYAGPQTAGQVIDVGIGLHY